MKVEVFNDTPEEEVKLRLALQQELDGVSLIAVNEKGHPLYGGYLLTVQHDGRICLHSDVNETLGLKLGCYGRVALVRD